MWKNAAFALLALATTVAGLAWYSRQPGVPFLPRDSRATWILYPQPDWYIAHRVARLDTEFRRRFRLEQPPRSATLSYRALGEAEVHVNGVLLPAGTATGAHDLERRDVLPHLRAGENELVVLVASERTPPALWLLLEVDGRRRLRSDTSWEASFAGAVWQPARSADDQLARLKLGRPLPRVAPALAQHGGRLTIFLAIGWFLWVAMEYWFAWRDSRLGEGELPRGLSTRETAVVAGLVFAAWAILCAHNARWIAPGFGFDAPWHKQYIQFLQQQRHLPPADAGAEMHQPPLYYALAAIVLTAARQTVTSDAGLVILRWLSALCGAAHVTFILLTLRRLFPASASRQLAGLVVALFLPVHLFIFQYVTNETLLAALSSASAYLTVRLLQGQRHALRWSVVLGLALGGALLTKLTAVVPVVAIAIALIGRETYAAWRMRRRSRESPPLPRLGWLCIATVFMLALLVSGWHYARMMHNYGTPFPRQVEHLGTSETWVAPGYHTRAHFTWFRRALDDPYFAGLDSFPDALYSTCWGDGRFGGSGRRYIRPPWTYDWMTLGYAAAVVPMALLAAGALLTLLDWIRRPTADVFFLWTLAALMISALVFENLRHPQLTVAKAWYALPAAVVVAFWAARGADWLSGGPWWLRLGTFPALFAWAGVAGAAFWVDAGAVETRISMAAKHLQRSRLQPAAPLIRSVLEHDPTNAEGYYLLGWFYAQKGDQRRAAEALSTAIEYDPQNAVARLALADALIATGRAKLAEEHLRTLLATAPDLLTPYVMLAVLEVNSGRLKAALETARQGLRLQPSQVELHTVAARAYREVLGDRTRAARHVRYALAIDPTYPPALEEERLLGSFADPPPSEAAQ